MSVQPVETSGGTGTTPTLHIYCIPCLDARYPEKVPTICGLGREQNNDTMLYPSLEAAPARDVCVVCLGIDHCPRCGA